MKANLSYWEKSSFYQRPQLLVVGAGIVGLCTAIFYQEQHPDQQVMIIDREVMPRGASTRNAGFACFGSMTELIADLKQQGADMTLDLIGKRWQGLRALRTLVGDDNMDFRKSGGYEIFLKEDQEKWNQVQEYLEFFNQHVDPLVGEKQTFSSSPKSFGLANTQGIIYNKAEGQLHPGKMIARLIELCQERKIKIVRGLEVAEILSNDQEVEIHLEKEQTFFAEKVLVATNGFSKKLFPQLDLKPARNQVLLTSPIPDLKIDGCYHYQQGYIYFRNVGNRLLLGGGRHWDLANEEIADYGSNLLIREKLMHFLGETILPNTAWRIEQEWSGILGVGEKKKPIIEKVHPRLGVAIRLGGMGVAIGCAVGKNAAAIMGEQ